MGLAVAVNVGIQNKRLVLTDRLAHWPQTRQKSQEVVRKLGPSTSHRAGAPRLLGYCTLSLCLQRTLAGRGITSSKQTHRNSPFTTVASSSLVCWNREKTPLPQDPVLPSACWRGCKVF